jgi:hypothetical protein
VKSSSLGWKVPLSGGKSSSLGRKVPGYAPRQCACKIPLQACCGTPFLARNSRESFLQCEGPLVAGIGRHGNGLDRRA